MRVYFKDKQKSALIIFSLTLMNGPNTIVVFDLDETLGHFSEISIFWSALREICGVGDKYHFFEVMDLFPEFLRPDIINILSYLVRQKNKGLCHKLMIYTNNRGPKSWVEMITEYFDHILNTTVFDHIVAAFKVQGKVMELCRTTQDKNVNDLLKCSNLPDDIPICFVDDQEHPLMVKSNVYYINVKPFYYSLNYLDMVERYTNTFQSRIIDIPAFINRITLILQASTYEVIHKDKKEIELDKVISKQLLLHLREFFTATTT